MTEAGWDREGFITSWMVSGPEVEPFDTVERETNQLRFEARLREGIARHEKPGAGQEIRAGGKGRLGLPWRVMCGREAALVNLSDFYPRMQRVRFDCAVCLESGEEREVQAAVWSFCACDVYVNGRFSGGIPSPVYKPIRRAEVRLSLKRGRNLVYLACETLGVRDTRSVVALQLTGGRGSLRAELPDEAAGREAARLQAFLDGCRTRGGTLILPGEAPAGTQLTYRHPDPDLAVCRRPAVWEDLEGKTEYPLREGEALVTLRVPASFGPMTRVMERTEQIRPQRVLPVPTREENLQLIFRRIAGVESLSRGEKFGFPIANLLCRRYLNTPSPEDGRLMREMLELIRDRVDCADFLVCGLIRYMKNYDLPPETAAEAKEALLGFRYWMDMDGLDGMCFWSENHALMFYASAMHAGDMFPDDVFPLARMTGRELSAWGRARLEEWLSDVEAWGFEEFLSTVYMCVTFAALLNVIDYSGEDISRRAWKVTDRLLEQLSLHVFKGGIIAPQGRVYRGVLYPFRQGAMALMNLIDPSLPYDYGEGWLGFFATSRYRLPEGLEARMRGEASLRYTTGNAEVVLEKHADWCLTSVSSPRGPFVRWENIAQKADTPSHAFTKSYNECFHGTTCFQPGVFGYQQHMWHAALDGEAAIFCTHPGTPSEGGDLRPGYWHGNGEMPALRQEGETLAMIYRISGRQMLHYIHLYAPLCRFDRVLQEGGWLFLQKGSGYIGLWASVPMEDVTGRNEGCEKRMYGDDVACVCRMGGREYPDLEAFRASCVRESPVYEGGELRAFGICLTSVPGEDTTQYL